MTRHPVLRPGDLLRLGGATHTVAGLDSATARPVLDRLPARTMEPARWWERHLIEVITGVPPDSPPGTRPRPA